MCVNTGCNSGCSDNCGCSCDSCSSGSCNTCCEETCGCSIEVSAACVRLGLPLDCLGVLAGASLEQALEAIDSIICTLSTGVDGDDGDDGQGIDHASLTNSTTTEHTYTLWGDVAETINLGTFTIPQVSDGADGVDGTDGTDGVDGTNGTNGADGADGQGVDHSSFTSSTGASQGLPGETDTYTLWGDVAETIVIGTYTAYNGADGAQGPQGVQGDDGIQGDQGPQGDQGDQGPTGATGATGAAGISGNIQAAVDITATGAGNFVVPAGVTQIMVEVWGAGSGASIYKNASEILLASGAGGGYVKKLLTVTPAASIPYYVGVGGASASTGVPTMQGVDGEDSTFDATITSNGGTAPTIVVGTPNTLTGSVGGGGIGADFLISGNSGEMESLPYLGPGPTDYHHGAISGGGAGVGNGGANTAKGTITTQFMTAASTASQGAGGACSYGQAVTTGSEASKANSGANGRIFITYFV